MCLLKESDLHQKTQQWEAKQCITARKKLEILKEYAVNEYLISFANRRL